MFNAGQNTSNFQAAMVGQQLTSKLSGIPGLGGLGGAAEGEGPSTQRSGLGGFQPKKSGMGFGFGASQGIRTDKSYSTNQKPEGSSTGGGLQVNLDQSLMQNILNTPSSEKSAGRGSAFSPDENSQK